jgi:hypothetical protein
MLNNNNSINLNNNNLNNYNQEDYHENDTDTESEYDYDELEDMYFEPNEISETRNTILLCELYNPHLHGATNNRYLETSYLVDSRFRLFNMELITEHSDLINAKYAHLCNNNLGNIINHPIFRNYKSIISKDSYVKPEIGECIYLETGECVAILKTFWVRLIQRKWKNIMREKSRVIRERCLPNTLKYREIHGRWPPSCGYLPTIADISDIKFNK